MSTPSRTHEDPLDQVKASLDELFDLRSQEVKAILDDYRKDPGVLSGVALLKALSLPKALSLSKGSKGRSRVPVGLHIQRRKPVRGRLPRMGRQIPRKTGRKTGNHL